MIQAVPCTNEEYTAAVSARTSLIAGARMVRVSVDGDLTEYTSVTLPQLNDTIAGMALYLESAASVESSILAGVRISGSKGF